MAAEEDIIKEALTTRASNKDWEEEGVQLWIREKRRGETRLR